MDCSLFAWTRKEFVCVRVCEKGSMKQYVILKR